MALKKFQAYLFPGTRLILSFNNVPLLHRLTLHRLVPGGLAESTGLLAVNDEVLEVNGIEVAGKSLDQVTDMMVANSANLIITVKPANQRGVLTLPRSSAHDHNDTMTSYSTTASSMVHSDNEDHEEEEEVDDLDEIKDLTLQTTGPGGESKPITATKDDGILHL